MKSTLRFTLLSLILTGVLTETATANLLLNGNFTSISHVGGNTYTYGQFGSNAGPATGAVLTVDNWSTSGYNFVYTPNTIDQGTTATGAFGPVKQAPGQATGTNPGNEYMWGSNNGGLNAFGTNPFAGNIVAADAAYETGAISQMVSGLRTGQAYTLTFWWAVAQQESYTAINKGNNWKVSLGSQTFTTTPVDLAAKGFSGWMQYTNTFTYTGVATSATLSFLAQQASGGSPPFLLLGEVSLVPEPSSGTLLALVGAGLTAGWFVRRRRLAAANARG